ncbi:hypothetical protein LWP59_16425 [Amycolatopsis acidiphila]|uniref:hypothetical protein n=1 Tax=Amycolatopsis acidiphila TaxID=715473 RepID=UPI001F43001D|nr:hypothetical protein [Amycolatopsis acidiphila]UIJ63099.1 hypothetical protein LWP59_16425 [Amycolatopsis acidiphila]
MSDNLMHDSPTEFLHNVANTNGECIAQSVIPNNKDTYLVACSCEKWETTAPTREEGLNMARRHTGSIA